MNIFIKIFKFLIAITHYINLSNLSHSIIRGVNTSYLTNNEKDSIL